LVLVCQVFISFVLFKHRAAMRADQVDEAFGTGNQSTMNPHYHVRQRYQVLYGNFTPQYWWWRLVLIARKAAFCTLLLHFEDVGA
jgi:hypothetical protein